MSLVNRVKMVKGQLLATDAEQKRRADLVTVEMVELCQMSWSLDPTNGIFFGNAISRQVSKGNALREMMDYLGLDASQVITIGDSFNDMAIFQVAGTKIAMGHAPPSLKQIADWVAPPVEEDGVAAAIEKFILDK